MPSGRPSCSTSLMRGVTASPIFLWGWLSWQGVHACGLYGDGGRNGERRGTNALNERKMQPDRFGRLGRRSLNTNLYGKCHAWNLTLALRRDRWARRLSVINRGMQDSTCTQAQGTNSMN